MKEILAKNLQSLFDSTFIHGECTYKGDLYEVWEVSDENFKNMCDMADDVFEKVCPNGMWRYSGGSVMERPTDKMIINNMPITAWINETDEWEILVAVGKKVKKYHSLLEYFCNEIGTSLPKNVCALAVDLAKANSMKMSELFKIYEG